jgi:Flp pilus assembly protein TadG
MRYYLHAFLKIGGDLLGQFRRDQSGNYLMITAVMMPALVGLVGLGTDYGLWTYTHQSAQSAADSGAASAARAYVTGDTSSVTMQANAVTSSYGFVNGVNGVTVTVNQPPQSGNYTGSAGAVEVIVKQSQTPIFSAVLRSQQFTITARSVALGTVDGKGCVLSLDGTASGATTGQGSTNVNLPNCSLYDNSSSASALTVGGSARVSALSVSVVGGISGQAGVTTTQGVQTGAPPMADPYASVQNPVPTGAVDNSCCSHGTATLDPGIYKNGMKLVAGANITLNPGVYYIEGSGLDVAGGATLTGTGVTLVFTSSNGSNYASATINGGATVNLTAPTPASGLATAGIVMFGDRNMPVGTPFTFNGGASQNFTGAIYVPKGNVKYAGGSNATNGCTQLIADTITFTGNSNFAINCTGTGTKQLGAATVALVE